MEFKDRLRLLRDDRNMSTAQLAALFAKSEGAIRMWESGRSKPDVDTLIKLAEYFGVTTDFLLGISKFRKVEDGEELIGDAKALLENLSKYSFGDDYVKNTNRIIRSSEDLCENENIWYFLSSAIFLIKEILSTIDDLVARSDDDKALSFNEMISALQEIVNAKEVLDGCIGALFSESLKPVWKTFEELNPDVDYNTLAIIFTGLTNDHKVSNKYIADKIKRLKGKLILRAGETNGS